MNKILTLFATIIFCTISTVMNAALEPTPKWDQQFRSDALEAYWLCQQKNLTFEAAQLIQKYLQPCPIEIINTENDSTIDFKVIFFDMQSWGSIRCVLYSNPLMFTVFPRECYPEIKPEESVEQFIERRATENSLFFRKLLYLPVAPVCVTIGDNKCDRVQYSFTLEPSKILKLKKISFTQSSCFLSYNDGTTEEI